MDYATELPPTPRQPLGSTLKDLTKETSGNALQELHRGSQRIWEGFWESPIQQRIARHLVILGLVAAAAFITASPAVNAKTTTSKPPAAIVQTEEATTLPAQNVTLTESIPQLLEQPMQGSSPQALPSTSFLTNEKNIEAKIFASFSQKEITNATKEIAKQFAAYKSNQEKLADTIDWETTVESVISDKRLGITETDKSFWKQRMLALIRLESEGKRLADPANTEKDPQIRAEYQLISAKGVGQIFPSTAAEIAKNYGVSKYDLTNGWDNTFFSLAYMLKLSEMFESTELGALAYHIGPGNMYSAISAYLIQVEKLPYDKTRKDIFENRKLTYYVKQYKINPETLVSSPAVTAFLKSLNQNIDIFYWYKLMGSEKAVIEFQQNRPTPQTKD